jgi:hypothetical protein
MRGLVALPGPVPEPTPEVNAEWRRILQDAGLHEGDLRNADTRRTVFSAIRDMYPLHSRPAADALDYLPPLEDLPLTTQEISAQLRQAVRAAAVRHRFPDPEVHLD